MDVATTSYTTTPPPDSADAPQQGPDDPLQSPDRLPVSVVAQRRMIKAGAAGSPARRSPRLSCLPPPQPSAECQDISSDDGSENAIDIALHPSREETPEDDSLPPDEPSMVLASRILRANDNPSPPPQDLAHPGINYVPGKDGHFPSHAVSAPPSPFRPINLLERLNQFSDPPYDHSRGLLTPAPGDRPKLLGSSIRPSRGFVSSESCSPFVASVSMKGAPHEDLESANTLRSSSAQYAVDSLAPRSSQHVREPVNFADDGGINASSQPAIWLHGQLMTITSSHDSETFSSSPTRVVDSSLNIVLPLASDVYSREPLPSPRPRSSPLAATLSSSPSNEGSKALLATGTTVTTGKDHAGEGSLSTENTSAPEELQEREYTQEVDPNSHRGLEPLSPHPTNALSEPTQQAILSTESPRIKHPPATPPQTPKPSVMHPDFSRSTIQRPIAPTPVQANNGARKLFSPNKFSSEAINDVCRTPAQRVPIETAFARGNTSLQKTIKLSAGSGHQGRLPGIRTLVFTRPALDDPSRSPAKRIPITDPATSPTRGQQGQSSPMRFGHRARSTSVEPRPLGPILSRSRSVEPCPMIPKPDSHDRPKESIFPMVHVPPKSGATLPFPLVPGPKAGNNLPPPIQEENETAEIGNTEIDATLARVTQGTMSHLRQPSANSRIPRIGNKPYARPPSTKGKATVGTATVYSTHTPASSFHRTQENSATGNDDIEASSIQPTNNLRLAGSLKRKRGAEVATSSNSHPVMIRQVVPGILSEKYAPKSAKIPSQVQVPLESSPLKATKPLKFRKVVNGMLSARYAPAKANLAQTGPPDSTSPPPSPISELSSSSNEEPSDDKLAPTAYPPAHSKNEAPNPSHAGGDAAPVESRVCDHSLPHRDTDGGESSSRPRRTSRNRKPAQQQYVLDVFNTTTSTRPPPARRKSKARTEDDGFMGMSATALKVLTTSNTTKNQQTVAVLATEVIRKEGQRPESPTVKARTILQKQRDERDTRVRERAQRRTQRREESLGTSDTEGLGDQILLGGGANQAENDDSIPAQKHPRGPGDDEDYETPERPERINIESLSLEDSDKQVKPVKQVKWHRGLSTAVYVNDVDPKPKPLPKNVDLRGCLAPTSKNLSLDPLGNLVDIDNRPFPELVAEQITVKKFLYDDDIKPEPIPAKMTRSKSKKSKS